MIMTPLSSSTPSISFNIEFRTCRDTLPASSLSLFVASASISSINTIDGADVLALRNTSLIFFSDSPTYLLKISGPLIARKFRPDSDASALAVSVLEQPGGPYNSSPLGAEIPSLVKVCAAVNEINCFERMSYLLSASGIGTSSSWSNLPGRLRPASIELSLLVAPITITAPSMLSMAIRSVAVTLVSTSETSSLFLLGVRESISSIRTIAGWYLMASLK
ncbi:hypothetical protein OGAPHI_000826 [Ogataea philodendri]|uniref:Uncharacterized protein n=1 Tax=Ogataea philodendri TaxID=1378263 RepID=A0A9P8PGD7_9ASCO|nr:uncharacterized protein OGAPHI_000826 [Ogataea philodendri]KAH3671115.1 hypothetical protein OGAPHI_000826 [Ogataea philodendri]